jgi:ABC-type molybdate transport system substrate-binding protein
VPGSANVPASYAGAVIKASPNLGAAHSFLDWFAGPEGQVILADYGFLPPGP